MKTDLPKVMTTAYALDLAPYLYILGGSIVIAVVLAWWMK